MILMDIVIFQHNEILTPSHRLLGAKNPFFFFVLSIYIVTPKESERPNAFSEIEID